jgi:hypothetical protein
MKFFPKFSPRRQEFFMKTNRFLFAAVITALAFTFFGCSSNGGDDDDGDSSSSVGGGNIVSSSSVGGGSSSSVGGGSSSSGGGESNANIVGTWIGTMPRSTFIALVASEAEMTTAAVEQALIQQGITIPDPVPMIKIIYNANGTYIIYEIDPIDGTEKVSETGTYSVSGNTVTAGVDQFTVSGNSFTFTVPGYGTITFTKQGSDPGPGPGPSGSITWTTVTPSPLGSDGKDPVVAYGGGKFVALGRNGEIAYSTDGVNWTAADGGISQPHAIAYGNGKFVAYGNGCLGYSADGITWTVEYVNSYKAIAYGGNRFVAVGWYGSIAYSDNGIAWTKVTSNVFDNPIWEGASYDINGVAYGNGRFVAVGAGGRIAYSSNGESWTAATGDVLGGIIRSIAFGGGRFVASSDTYGRKAYSDDGITWTASSGDNFHAESIVYGENRFVGVGNSGIIGYSANGASWTEIAETDRPSGGGINVYFTSIAYGSGRFVAVGDNNNGGWIVYSNALE